MAGINAGIPGALIPVIRTDAVHDWKDHNRRTLFAGGVCGLIDSGLYVEAFSELDYTSAMGPGMGMIRNGKDQNSNCR